MPVFWQADLRGRFWPGGLFTGRYEILSKRQHHDRQLQTARRAAAVSVRYFAQPDDWGGRLSVDAGAFNVVRTDGTDTRRASMTLNWERPFRGSLGDEWTLAVHNDAAAYDASSFEQQPNFGTHDQVDNVRALPQASINLRWPFMRDSGSWGTQVIEPMAEVIVAPRSARQPAPTNTRTRTASISSSK